MCIYISILLMVLCNSKIQRINEYTNPLSMENSNAMKGLAALVVVIHHCCQRMSNPGILILFRYMGNLSVSLFFFYSGFGLMKSYNYKENYLKSLWVNRIPKIIIPFILSNIIFIVIYIIIGERFDIYEVFLYILGFKLIDDFKWYIISSIILYIIFYFMFKYLKKIKAILVILFSIIIYAVICRIIGTGTWWYKSIFCFFIGILVAEYYDFLFNYLRNRYLLFTSVTIILFILICGLNIINGNIIMSIISSVLFVLSCIYILMKIEIRNGIIKFIGSISYEIYLLHRIPLEGLKSINNNYIYLIITVLLSITLAYIFSKFSRKVINIYINYNIKQGLLIQ